MIEDIKISSCEESDFVKVQRIHYKQKGIQKSWDMVHVHDSVAILLYNKDTDAFVIVKQFRPPLYLRNTDGFTYELCAGIVDKDCSLEQIAKEEIDEECGYEVKVENIEKITSFYTAVGFAGSKQTLYYCEVDNSVKKHIGGGIDTEEIEVVYLKTKDAKKFILDEGKNKTPGIMYAFMWWFDNRAN